MNNQSLTAFEPMITIDSQSAIVSNFDRDDGFWLEKTDQGWRVKIYIVDLVQEVPLDSEIDKRGYERLFSQYATHHIVSSLFGEKIEKKAGFMPQENRGALEISFLINKELIPEEVSFRFCQAKNLCALDNKTVNFIFYKRQHKYYMMLMEAGRLTWFLYQKRINYDFSSTDNDLNWISLPSNGYSKELLPDRYNASAIVSELMILANTLATDYLRKNLGLLLYRNEVVENGYKRAEYSPIGQRHETLKLPYYGQFSSPLRRYADLINLRLLAIVLSNQTSPYSFKDLVLLASTINKQETDLQHKISRGTNRQINPLIRPGDTNRRSRYSYERIDKNRQDHLNQALKNQTIDFKDLYEVVFVDRFDCLPELTDYLKNWPQKGPSLLNEAFQKSIINQLDFTINEELVSGDKVFSVQVSFIYQDKVISLSSSSADKKQAKQEACLQALIAFLKI